MKKNGWYSAAMLTLVATIVVFVGYVVTWSCPQAAGDCPGVPGGCLTPCDSVRLRSAFILLVGVAIASILFVIGRIRKRDPSASSTG